MTDVQKLIANEIINLYWYGMKRKPLGFTFQEITYSSLRLPDVLKTDFEYELPIVKEELVRLGILKKIAGYGSGNHFELSKEGRLFRF